MKESLRQAGQRLMVGFEGLAPSADLRALIKQYGVGHVILFARNVDGPEQLAELAREIQAIARDAGHDLPVMIGVDQEGGRVARLREPWTLWPSLRAVGRLASEPYAERMGRALAAELEPCGIHWDFAPVVDVDTNPKNPVIGDRSFGDDPGLVGRLGAAMIRGLQEGRVAACAKHFPGHGDTDIDSHLELPVVTHPLSRLEEVELPPFRAAIEAGVVSVMTAHVLIPELDESLPATLSPRILERLLRRHMKYDGVVVTDDMEMKAMAKGWGAGEAAVLAAQAGCDLVGVSKTPESQVAAVEALVRARESDAISATAMDASLLRLRRLKERFLLPYRDPDPKQARLAAGVSERVMLAEEIAERGGLPERA